MENKPILDTILKSKQTIELTKFNPTLVVSSLFLVLTDREREVLKKRHALEGQSKHTLEKIGQDLKVTRERVRQIELSAVRKIKSSPAFQAQLAPVEKVVSFVLESHGGLMEHGHLLENLLSYTGEEPAHQASASFVLSQLLNDRFNFIESHDHIHPSWKTPNVPENEVVSTVTSLVNLIENKKEPVDHDILLKEMSAMDEKVLNARLRASKKIKSNVFGQWGISEWNTVTPKRMNDKIYLVLKQYGKPLHFTDIAKQINEMKFDAKTAYPATVHNELILDKKYVLVGRGIYALAEWGYKKGVVADVIADVMSGAGKPLTRDEIVESVLKQRMVGKTTIHLALMNKGRFVKTSDGKFVLAAASLAAGKTQVA